jgi:Fur family ferric uptake transcriptional regulator
MQIDNRSGSNQFKPTPRLNRGCTLVLHCLRSSKGLHTAREIWAMLKQDDQAPGLTTVYRALDTLLQMQLVQEIAFGQGEKSYEYVEPGMHHHHLICIACHESVHLDQCLVDDMRGRIEDRHNFTIRAHVLEILGLCQACQKL